MGVELKWEIDAAEDQARQLSEAGSGRGRRRKLFLHLLLLLTICALIAGALYLRLQELERQQENLLRATVEAEVTALRFGDELAFLDLQNSGDSPWQLAQQENFVAWQRRKLEGGNLPGGDIRALELDGEQAWVQVQETIADEPWLHTWHYRLTPQGWRHVSAREGWRGPAQTLHAEDLRIEYESLDEPLAQSLAPQLSAWLARGCALLDCPSTPQLIARIQAQPGAPSWSPNAIWTLLLPSPWVQLTRTDEPLNAALSESLAQLLAGRLLNERAGQPGPDWTQEASWLYGSARAWLVNRMQEQESRQLLLESLDTNYGESAVARLIAGLQPGSSLTLLNAVTGTSSPHEATLDWSDLLTWQLQQEAERRLRGDRDAFLALYDLSDGALGVLARARFAVGEFAGAPTVDAVALVSATDSGPLLRADVRDSAASVPVHFRLVDGRWLRAS